MNKWVDFKAIKAAADFRPVLEHYGIRLKAKGPELTGLCPFHQDTKPSFRINLEKNVFHCFGCSAKGNIIDFVARKEGCTIRRAAELVAEWCGVGEAKTPVSGNTKIAAPPEKSRPRGSEGPREEAHGPSPAPEGNRALTFVLKLDPGHSYLQERGLSAETVEAFGLGYCSRGVMKGRIAIPLHDAGAALVGYAGRWPGEPPEGEPKYKLPEGFKKSLLLFNLNRLLAFRTSPDKRVLLPVILVEGYWSVFRLHQLGYPNAVALMGKELSPAQEALLARYAERVVVMTDGDPPGREAQRVIVARLARRLWVAAVDLPDGTQPHTVPEEELRKLLGATP